MQRKKQKKNAEEKCNNALEKYSDYYKAWGSARNVLRKAKKDLENALDKLNTDYSNARKENDKKLQKELEELRKTQK